MLLEMAARLGTTKDLYLFEKGCIEMTRLDCKDAHVSVERNIVATANLTGNTR